MTNRFLRWALVQENHNMLPFHFAFKVRDLESTRKFYGELLGCAEGRSTDHWVDFNFFGNQISAHISKEFPTLDYCGKVDGISVPIPHFGCVINYEHFNRIHERFKAGGVKYLIEPRTRYEGQKGEQQTMFVLDFSGNPLEFKAFKNEDEIFQQ